MMATQLDAARVRVRPPVLVPRVGRRRRRTLAGLAFCGPALIVTVAFTVYPLLQSIRLSFVSWNLVGEQRYVGLDNYAYLAEDSAFRTSVTNTVVYTVATLVGTYVLALAAALLLHQQLRATRILRTIAVVPVLLPMVVAGLVWRWLLEPDSGLAVFVVEGLTGFSPNWLFDTSLALPSVILVGVWKEFGLYMLVFLIGLQGIRPELIEAAQIDGAGGWQRFRLITLPLLRPASIFAVTLITFNSLKVFDQIYVMTRGGPGGATRSVVMFVYENLLTNVGLASAASVVLFVIALTVSILRFRRDGGRA
jgi:ABC-type sugar transport system permease subunit